MIAVEMVVAAVLIGVIVGMAASLPVFRIIDWWMEKHLKDIYVIGGRR